MLEAAEFTGPEVFIVLKGMEFIVPSDIALLFEFKDSRLRSKKYTFTGSVNKIDISAIEIFAQMLSILKWMTRLPQALQDFELELEEEERKLNLSHELLIRSKVPLKRRQNWRGKPRQSSIR